MSSDKHDALTGVPYVVRLWDGFDGEWMDVHGPCSQEEAEQVAGDRNEARTGSAAGKREGGYGDIDYYRAFPANTRMRFSGGNSMTRGRR